MFDHEPLVFVVDPAEDLVELAKSDHPYEGDDCCLADVEHHEYCAAQATFPGFVDEDDNPLGVDIAQGDDYA